MNNSNNQKLIQSSYKVVDRKFEEGGRYVQRGYVLRLDINGENEDIWVSKKSYFDSYAKRKYSLNYKKSFFYDYLIID